MPKGRFSAAQKQSILAQFRVTKSTARNFADSHGISSVTLYRWLKAEANSITISKSPPILQKVALVDASPSTELIHLTQQDEAPAFFMNLASGTSFEFQAGTSPDFVVNLLKGLHSNDIN